MVKKNLVTFFPRFLFHVGSFKRQETVHLPRHIQQGASIPSAGASSFATALCQHQYSLVTVHSLGKRAPFPDPRHSSFSDVHIPAA